MRRQPADLYRDSQMEMHEGMESAKTTRDGRKKESVLTNPLDINEDWWDLKRRALKAREQGRKMREYYRAARNEDEEHECCRCCHRT